MLGHVRSLCGHKGQNFGACSVQTASGNGWSVVMSDPKFVRFYTLPGSPLNKSTSKKILHRDLVPLHHHLCQDPPGPLGNITDPGRCKCLEYS